MRKTSLLTARIRRSGTALVLLGAVLASPAGWRWSVGVLAGGAVFIVSVMGIGMVVRASLLAGRASPGSFVFYILRLILIFALLGTLVRYDLASVGGMLIGVSLVVGTVLYEGWREAERG